jgi:hypothetical protein
VWLTHWAHPGGTGAADPFVVMAVQDKGAQPCVVDAVLPLILVRPLNVVRTAWALALPGPLTNPSLTNEPPHSCT